MPSCDPDSAAARTVAPGALPSHSREQLAHLLAEAAELEHNLLCCYLYAAFSLKQGELAASGSSQDNFPAQVKKWRGFIIKTAMEEMTHLALIANLSVAIGLRPHFNRPNLPVAPLYHPADLVVELAPFNMDTLTHFIYLERPDGSDLPDGESFAARRRTFERGARPGASLMPSAIDYDTIGEFYEHLRSTFEALAADVGEAALFCGPAELQVGPDMVDLPGLVTISGLADAQAALNTIITQGEGGRAGEADDESHYVRFVTIRDELAALEASCGCDAAWPAARNPLMRKPADPSSGVHITAPESAAVLDLGNAVYALTLRLLAQAWGARGLAPADKTLPKAALNAAMSLMGIMGAVGNYLCTLPAGDASPGVHAGLTFTVPRATEPLVAMAEQAWISERLSELARGLDQISARHPALLGLQPRLRSVMDGFQRDCCHDGAG